ncbi:MAG TPA: iron chelate uptake ABC transporter family permease subunit [Haploplasma sp.]|nr:iron chelate uptake ABC transporter family permease subunit [Haploplasma sp.]
MTKQKRINIILVTIAIISIVLYLFSWFFLSKDLVTESAFKKIMNTRILHVVAITVSGILIALASLSFQTITNNRLLTPSMIGFDAIFVATQTLLVFIFGQNSSLFANDYFNFIISTVVMLVVTLSLYGFILKKNKNQIFVLLLVGMVISTLVRSLTGFLQRVMNPTALDSVLSASMVSITNINTTIILLVVPIMIVLIGLFYRRRAIYDAMALGEDVAINLGVNYHVRTNETMVYIAISLAISTALIGPVTFLGLVAVNIARELLKSYSHKLVMIGSAAFAVISLVLGQLIIETLNLHVTVTVIINFLGGAYMIYLIWGVNKND